MLQSVISWYLMGMTILVLTLCLRAATSATKRRAAKYILIGVIRIRFGAETAEQTTAAAAAREQAGAARGAARLRRRAGRAAEHTSASGGGKVQLRTAEHRSAKQTTLCENKNI